MKPPPVFRPSPEARLARLQAAIGDCSVDVDPVEHLVAVARMTGDRRLVDEALLERVRARAWEEEEETA